MDELKFALLRKKIKTEPINFRIVSDSMLPLIKVGEKISMTKLPEKLNIFDIIVFYDKGKLICHFVWLDQKVFNDTVITRSLKDPYKNELPRAYKNLLGWVPSKKISWTYKTKIILLNWMNRSL